jgi:probable F420-dependent oxidoreductase
MRRGVVFPQLEIGSEPAAVRRYAGRAEQLGFQHLACFDHVVGAHPGREDARTEKWPRAAYDHRDAFHEPLTLFGFLAGITTELELATGILVLPQRQTVLVAKQAAEIDLLSGERLRLGVGLGWNHLEFEALGVPWERRGARLSEQLEVMRRLWTEPVVEFEGEFHSLPKIGLEPRPKRGIPIWTGANSPPALRRAARHADGVISQLGGAHRALPSWVDDVRRALEEEGRDQAGFGIEGRVDIHGRGDEEVVEDLERWRQIGASHVSVNTMVAPKLRDRPSPLEWHLEALERFAELSAPRPA